MIGALVARDLRRALNGGGLWLPLAFLLLIAALFPFAVGPDATLLARTGGGCCGSPPCSPACSPSTG